MMSVFLNKLAHLLKTCLRIEQQRTGNVITLKFYLGKELITSIDLDITPVNEGHSS